ncbi:putative Peptidase C65 Otubain-domain-containing protein [Seiridium cardinale]
MFQPISTPLLYQTSYGVANANIPEYTFAPTPLGQGGSSGGATAGGLSPDAAANVYASPIFSSLLDNNTNNNNNPQLHHRPRNTYSHHRAQSHKHSSSHSGRHNSVKMEPPSDLAQQEAAARDYQPELEGPLVGEKKSSHAITQEYAKANPIYVTKTIALPQTYSLYRQIQGDGNCGWRAIGFGYFENLIKYGDVNQLQAESARLATLNDFIEKVGGYSPYVFEDMTEVTCELLAEITEAISQGQDAMPILTEKWNKEETSAPMIYHLRLLAASWLKGNLAQYKEFITGDADTYCEEWILPVNKEIDQIAVDLLFNVFLKPANIVLEIAYLDTSPGTEVNVHRWPDDAKDRDPAALGPIVCLLYRPDHYDILYRDAVAHPPQPPATPTTVQVNRVTSLRHQHDIQSTVPSLGTYADLDMTTLSMIPGFDSAAFAPLGSPAPVSSHGSAYSPSPQSAWMPQPFPEGVQSAPSPISSTHSAAPSQPSPQPQSQETSLTSLRFSKHMYSVPGGAESNAYAPEPTFQVQTNIFKQSFYNTAHYNNPHFQPEEYRPDQDDEIPTARMGGRKRSS